MTDNPSGPGDFEIERTPPADGPCPFCPGQEAMTSSEILAVRPPGSVRNGPGWSVRVVPNKFPALRIEGELIRRGMGVFDLCSGIGAHEVVIETPDHARQLADLAPTELEQVLQALLSRSRDLRGDRRLKYALIFKNYGLAAGATVEHTHSQIIALPIVPKRVQEELRGAEQYYAFRERCVFCDMLRQDLNEQDRIVAENRSFAAVCPYVSSFPFEVWLLPKRHQADVVQMSPEEVADLARMLRETLGRLRGVLEDPPYNFILHTVPMDARQQEAYHWHIELIPKLTKVAGFEWGTGFYINPTPPELAAKALREAKVQV